MESRSLRVSTFVTLDSRWALIAEKDAFILTESTRYVHLSESAILAAIRS